MATLGKITPILRSFDEAKAREFFVDFLGFTVDWEHRFEPSLPLYMQVSKDDCIIHLSEHHGDCSPGAAIRIAKEIGQEQVGKTIRALVDQPLVARAAADAPDIDGRILLKTPAPVGEFVNVRITGTQVYDLLGEVVP